MRSPRGFFILIILVVLAVMSAAVIAQFASTGNSEVISIRSSDDSRARALAESCLAMLQTMADKDLGLPSPPGPGPAANKDFDEILNPNVSTAIDGDEFYPKPRAGETPVSLPKGLTCGAANNFDQRHCWLLIPQTVGTERGACMVRWEDNNDDSLPQTQLPGGGTTDQAVEGTGVDIPFLDRDRAIYLTAIGLFPFLPSTTAADAYNKAHARVTLRRLYNAAAVGGGAPALWAGGIISGIKGPVCGPIIGAGFSPKGSPIRGSGCGCGTLTFPTSSPLPPQCSVPVQCPLGTVCNAPSAVVKPVDDPTRTAALDALKPFGNWAAFSPFDNQNFGPAPAPPGNSSNDLSNPKDLAVGPPQKATCKLYFKSNGEVYVWDRRDTAAGGTEDCTRPTPYVAPFVYNTEPVKDPTTSACWKLVKAAGAGNFSPSGAIPGANPAANWGATPGNPDYLCGDPTPAAPTPGPCSKCALGTANGGTFAAGTWSFNATTNEDLPVPAYITVENSAPTATTVFTKTGSATTGPLHASFAVNSNVTLDGDGTSLCGASCTCGLTNVIPPPCTSANALAGQSCYAIRARGDYRVTSAGINAVFVIGAIRAATFMDNLTGAGCYLGDVAAMGGGSDCHGSGNFCSGTDTMCWLGLASSVGNMYSAGNIITQGAHLWSGQIAGRGGLCTPTSSGSATGLSITGSVIVDGRIEMKGSQAAPARLIFVGPPAGSAINALKSMMETAW